MSYITPLFWFVHPDPRFQPIPGYSFGRGSVPPKGFTLQLTPDRGIAAVMVQELGVQATRPHQCHAEAKATKDVGGPVYEIYTTPHELLRVRRGIRIFRGFWFHYN